MMKRQQRKEIDSGGVMHQRDDVNLKSGFQFDLKCISREKYRNGSI